VLLIHLRMMFTKMAIGQMKRREYNYDLNQEEAESK
jgi:hypothetical protein